MATVVACCAASAPVWARTHGVDESHPAYDDASDRPSVELRGTFCARLQIDQTGPLQLTIRKRDDNLRDGPDSLMVVLQGPTGDVIYRAILPDDGDSAASGRRGKWQDILVLVPQAPVGQYIVRAKPDRGRDLQYRLIVNRGRWVMAASSHTDSGRRDGRELARRRTESSPIVRD